MTVFNPEKTDIGIKQTNRLVRHAIGLDPAHIIASAGDTLIGQSDFIVTDYRNHRPGDELLPDTLRLVINNLADSRAITNRIIELHPSHMTVEQLITIATQAQSIDATARLAAHPSHRSRLFVHEAGFYGLNGDHSAIEVYAPADTPNLRTFCPAVMKDGELSPSQLFSDFIPWATELAARSILLHPRTVTRSLELKQPTH
jgi:hypothetical protein